MKKRREFVEIYDKIHNETSTFIDKSIKSTEKIFKKLNDRQKLLFGWEDKLFQMKHKDDEFYEPDIPNIE